MKGYQVVFTRIALFWVSLLLIGFEAHTQDFTLSEKIAVRFSGPFHFRFVFQPLMAIALGFKDGRTDEALKRPPFILRLFTHKKSEIKHLFGSVSKVLIVAVVLDVFAQLFIFHSIRILGALLVAVLIITPPYVLARSITNYLLRNFFKTKCKS